MAPLGSAIEFVALDRRPRLPDEIARRIAARVQDGHLAPGQRLPTEAALGRQFGVSRSVIREAIARLKVDGVVTTRQGLGAFVSDNPTGQTFRIDPETLRDSTGLYHVFELRTEVEAAAAALAALRATAAQRAGIAQARAALAEAIGRGDDGTEADLAFHLRIAEAANNPCLSDLMAFLAERLRASIEAARRHSRRHAGWTDRAQNEHEAIAAAIARGDGEAARAAMRAHLVNAAGRLGLRPHPSDPPVRAP